MTGTADTEALLNFRRSRPETGDPAQPHQPPDDQLDRVYKTTREKVRSCDQGYPGVL
jgi:hypothetical protein